MQRDQRAIGGSVGPQTIDVVRTRARPLGIEVAVGPAEAAADADCFAVLLQYPGAGGEVRDYRDLSARLHAKDALVIVATAALLTILRDAPKARATAGPRPGAAAWTGPTGRRREGTHSHRTESPST